MLTSINSSVTSNSSSNFQPIEDQTNKMCEVATKIFCNFCKKENARAALCSRCKQLYYCNTTCQKNDWPLHKGICKPSDLTTSPKKPTFCSDKLVLNRKKMEDHFLPVYSPKKNLTLEFNFSQVANICAFMMMDQIKKAETLIQKKINQFPEMSGREIIIPNTTFIKNLTLEFLVIKQEAHLGKKEHLIPAMEKAETLLNGFFKKIPEIEKIPEIGEIAVIKLSSDLEKTKNLLIELKKKNEIYIYENSEGYGNHIIKFFEISEQDVTPFGGKELISKINPYDFSCAKYAFLKSGEKRAKNLIFDTKENSLIIQIQELLKVWGYKPVEVPKKGDLILYFYNLKPVHLGIYVDHGRVLSKHGYANPYIVEHEIFDVIESYGNDAVFYSLSK